MATSGLGKVRTEFVANTGYRGSRTTSHSFDLESGMSLVEKMNNVGALSRGKSVHGEIMSCGGLEVLYKSIYTFSNPVT